MSSIDLLPHSMQEHNFYVETNSPITFVAVTRESFDDTHDRTDGDLMTHQEYYYPTTPCIEQSNAQPKANHWGFQPDPQHEGRWTAIPQPIVTPSRKAPSMGWDYRGYYSYSPPPMSYTNFAQSYEPGPLYSPVIKSHSLLRAYSGSSASSASSYHNSPDTEPKRWFHGQEQHYLPHIPLASHSQPAYHTPSPSDSSAYTSPVQQHPVKQRRLPRFNGRTQRTKPLEISYRCRTCRESFSKRSSLHEHERNHDENRSKIICPIPGCGKDFGRRAELARHDRSTHKGLKHFCRYCEKGFNRSDICRRHENDSCKKRENFTRGPQQIQPRTTIV